MEGAEHDDLADLEEEVAIARASTISVKSRASYLGSTVRFLEWMFKNKASLICADFSRAVSVNASGVPDKASLRSALSTAPDNPPIDFDRITERDFMTWIVSLKKPNGFYHSFSTYAGHRSAFYNLVQDYHRVMSRDFARELSSHFKGFQRKVAEAFGQGRGQIKVGKDPMPLGLYRQVAMAMLINPSRDMIFARTFMIMSWNLMSRAANTASICYGHLEWREDALCVYFAHMKNDQRGSRPRDPRHAYANPTAPEICPILALGTVYLTLIPANILHSDCGNVVCLGVYWASYSVDDAATNLFPGNDQYERFRKVLGRVLNAPAIAQELVRRGTSASDIGTHSMRKGASTFCSSGSTACPPAVAVHLRAGWAMGGVQDRYLRHDAAGGMFIGRTVSGLPILQPEFAVLPPHFTAGDDAVQRAKQLCFSGLPQSVQFVAEFALASIIYHLDFLRQHLPESHPLFQSPLFADLELLEHLRSIVRTFGSTESDIQPTGIPPHVTILNEVRAARNVLREVIDSQKADANRIVESQNELYERLISGVTSILDERAYQSGVPTCNNVADSIMKRLDDVGVLARLRANESELVHNDNEPTFEETEALVEQSSNAISRDLTSYPVYNWGGNMHLFPEHMKLPSGTTEQAWVFWRCGDAAKNLPPFRQLKPHDLVNRNQRKRLCELKFLMKKIELRAEGLGLLTDKLYFAEASTVFHQCKDAIELPSETTNSRKRRRGQLVWVTAATILRKHAKTTVISHAGGLRGRGGDAELHESMSQNDDVRSPV